MASLPRARSGGPEKRLLAVGGIHVFQQQSPCGLLDVEPAGAVKELGWSDMLALQAESEGTAEVECAAETFGLEIVIPVHIDIEVVDGEPTEVGVRERFQVKARLSDHWGRELEVGKFTAFEWTCSGGLEVANDRSAGEFGFCDTCYGMHHFRAVEPGHGCIEVRLGNLRGILAIEARL
jgi:hypothetical protein